MIEKLRSAGLGFYVRETDTQQKLGMCVKHIACTLVYWIVFMYMVHLWLFLTGKIPLRELVYRVIDLPPSMRPLVYDFGQLNTDTEKDYTTQIVHDHVRSVHTLEILWIILSPFR